MVHTVSVIIEEPPTGPNPWVPVNTPSGTKRHCKVRAHAIGVLAAIVSVWPSAPVAGATRAASDSVAAQGLLTVERLLLRAHAQHWDTLAIGERVARFGLALEGTPYVDGTLEGPGPEVCRVTTSGFDCVTFMELCLDLARVTGTRGADAAMAPIGSGGVSDPVNGARATAGRRATPADVRAAVTFTRYRHGRLTDYTSRLHYTSEWIADNVAKGVLEDVTSSLGGKDCTARVDFMSTHPHVYPALKTHPAYVDSMRRIERAVGRLPRWCIPKDRVAAIESKLRSGDLIAVATSIEGLDYAHTGIIARGGDGVARFMHASSRHGRVILDGSLSDYLAGAPKSFIGVTVVRPREAAAGR